MELFKINHDIPFMSWGKITTTISLVTFIVAVCSLIYQGLNLSVEFTGGTVMEVKYEQPIEAAAAREALKNVEGGRIQAQALSAKELLLRLPNSAETEAKANAKERDEAAAMKSNQIMAALQQSRPDAQISSVHFIGPQVGKELLTNGILALTFVILGMVLYLSVRFEWRFAVSAIIANMHDVTIILGCFSLFQWEFSLTVLAGVLAVLGYSVNESVVVFDRIRENFRKPSMRQFTVPEIIDNAITRTMSRTVITHGSTEVMVLSMLIFGGPALHGFSVALTIGILFGIYSSVMVASPLLLMFGLNRHNLVRVEKKKEEIVV